MFVLFRMFSSVLKLADVLVCRLLVLLKNSVYLLVGSYCRLCRLLVSVF